MTKLSKWPLKNTYQTSNIKKSVSVRLLLTIFLVVISNSFGQFSGNNLLEVQYGHLPQDTASVPTVYDRAVVNFDYKSFRINTTLEQFLTPTDGSSYLGISQFLLQYKSSPLEVKLGNFYELLGRGLLLRSFEIPGAILEDLSYRSRHYFNRDILGMNIGFRHKNFNARALYGKPLNYVFPPTQSFVDRRPDTIGAISADYSLRKQVVELSAMYHSNSGGDRLYGSASAAGNISNSLSYYTELARNLSDFEIGDFSDQSSFAFYSGINVSYNSFGLSAEYKNYNNFLIGSGINEPPALVKEHSYKVLNRSTHVLQPINETGYQLELFYTFADLSTLTFNNTLARNDFGEIFKFTEYFIEYNFNVFDLHEIKLFTDYAKDPFKLEEWRVSAGGYAAWKVSKHSSLRTNYEFQTFSRLNENVQNHVIVLGYSYRSKFIFNLETEYSDDSYITDEDSKIWIGVNARYRLNNSHSLQLFAGERRGGPACNAGVCYEVLDFKGVELRITSRF